MIIQSNGAKISIIADNFLRHKYGNCTICRGRCPHRPKVGKNLILVLPLENLKFDKRILSDSLGAMWASHPTICYVKVYFV